MRERFPHSVFPCNQRHCSHRSRQTMLSTRWKILDVGALQTIWIGVTRASGKCYFCIDGTGGFLNWNDDKENSMCAVFEICAVCAWRADRFFADLRQRPPHHAMTIPNERRRLCENASFNEQSNRQWRLIDAHHTSSVHATQRTIESTENANETHLGVSLCRVQCAIQNTPKWQFCFK